MSGYEVLRSLRRARVQTPVLVLSGLAGVVNKVKGLGYGADDYLTKPFHKDELIARTHAVVAEHGKPSYAAVICWCAWGRKEPRSQVSP